MSTPAGRHFLQIPGPTNVPDRILRAIERPTMDHRGPAFGRLGQQVLSGLREIFRTRGEVLIFPSSGTGAWEAALVNTLSPGDTVLMSETGHFSTLWSEMARKLGLHVEVLEGDWRTGADPVRIEARLAEDRARAIKAVAVVHNETSTGVTSRIGAVRAALDAAGHPALLLVDTISSLASIDYRHDEWGVDVTVGGSQKGLMLPPGLGFNAVSERALAASATAGMTRSYWDWQSMLGPNRTGFFPYTPATNLLYGLAEAIDMLLDEGWRTCSDATTGMPRRRDAQCVHGGWRCGAAGRRSIRPRSPRFGYRTVTAPMRCAAPSWRPSTCRSATDSGASPTRCFASDTWATSTTSCSPGRSPASRWGSAWPACRTNTAG